MTIHSPPQYTPASIGGVDVISSTSLAITNAAGPTAGVNITFTSTDGSVTITESPQGTYNFHTAASAITTVNSTSLAVTNGTGPVVSVNITLEATDGTLTFVDSPAGTWNISGANPVPGVQYVTGLVNDTFATDQTTIISNAIAALPAAGGTLMIPEGSFGIQNLIISKANVKFQCAGSGSNGGNGATVFGPPNLTNPLFVMMASGTNFGWEDGDILSRSQSQYGLVLDGISPKLVNAYFANGQQACLYSTANCQTPYLVNVRCQNAPVSNLVQRTSTTMSIPNNSANLSDSGGSFTALDIGRMIGMLAGINPGSRIQQNTTVVAGNAALTPGNYSGTQPFLVSSTTHMPASDTIDIVMAANGVPTSIGQLSYTSVSAGQLNNCTYVSGSGTPLNGFNIIAHHQARLDQNSTGAVTAGTTVSLLGCYTCVANGSDWDTTNCRFVEGMYIQNSAGSAFNGNNHFTFSSNAVINTAPGTLILEGGASFGTCYVDSCPAGAAGAIVHKVGGNASNFGPVFTFQNAGPNVNVPWYQENDTTQCCYFESIFMQQPGKANSAWSTLFNLGNGTATDLHLNELHVVGGNTTLLAVVGGTTNGFPTIVTGLGNIGFMGPIFYNGLMYGSGSSQTFQLGSDVALTGGLAATLLTAGVMVGTYTVDLAGTYTIATTIREIDQYITTSGATSQAGGAAALTMQTTGQANSISSQGTVIMGGSGSISMTAQAVSGAVGAVAKASLPGNIIPGGTCMIVTQIS